MNTTLKRHLISAVVTFISTFSFAVLPFLGDTEWTKSALFALILVGLRAGVKALFEYFSKLNLNVEE